MVVLILESVPPSLRGELSRWMLEPKAGVFIGTLSGTVRDLLWEKACVEVGAGGCTMLYRTNTEQGFAVRTHGDTTRQVEEIEGLFLVRRPPLERPMPERAVAAQEGRQATHHPLLWAKSPRNMNLAPEDPQFHPLICHLTDAAMVAQQLWRRVLAPQVKGHLTRALGLESEELAGRWIAFFVGLHDLGKATPGFASLWPEGWDRLIAAGYPGLAGKTERAPHDVMSQILLTPALKEIGFTPEVARPIAGVLGAHHGLFVTDSERRTYQSYGGDQRWASARRDLVYLLLHLFDLTASPRPSRSLEGDLPAQVILAGLTSVADWIASDVTSFPFQGEQVDPVRYARAARKQARFALRKLGWRYRPTAFEPLPFAELFDKTPNDLQRALAGVRAELAGPSLVLVEYPMGGGKTEGALYLADHLAGTQGQQGLYFALPTMATSNQMFRRVRQYLQNRFPETAVEFQLLHGQGALNAEFQLLRSAGDQERARLGPIAEDHQNDEGLVLASEWFTYKKRGLLAPFGVGTVDQALVAILQTKHYFVRLFGLAGKVVIFDEIHAYDAFMSELFEHLLMWLGALGSSVILLSATLPSQTRVALVRAYQQGRFGRVDDAAGLPPAAYPRLTWASGMGTGAKALPSPPSRPVAVVRWPDGTDDWIAALLTVVEQGGCVAIICNTVGRAQAVYGKLTAVLPSEDRLLFHARFPFEERDQRERAVLGAFGPSKADRPKRLVLVATQVVEQSLDLDFDLLVTELCPVDLLLQRIGRLWRHPHTPRPPSTTAPTVWLLEPDVSPEGLPLFQAATRRVYEHHLLLRTALALEGKETIELPAAIEGLIESVYTAGDPPPELDQAWASAWRESRAKLERVEIRDANDARGELIPSLTASRLVPPAFDLDEENPGTHAAFRARTRRGGPSVEVVCLYQQGDGRVTTQVSGAVEVDLAAQPNGEGVLPLLGRSLRIGFHPGLVLALIDQEGPTGWRRSPYLRNHRLLLLDPDGRVRVDKYQLRLDPELGLLVERGEEDEPA
jgi:CRISPR-associated endonuclease/helicase Cas3